MQTFIRKSLTVLGMAFGLTLYGTSQNLNAQEALPDIRFDATPDNNELLLGAMFANMNYHTYYTLAGFSPDPFVNRNAEIGEMVTNLVYRAIPPLLEVPPDMYYQTDNDGVGCYRTFSLPQFNAVYENLLGFIPLQDIPADWSLLSGYTNGPAVYHANTPVLLSAYINNWQYEDNAPIRLPEGVHNVDWVAQSQFSVVGDAVIPAALIVGGVLAETKYGKAAIDTLTNSAFVKKPQEYLGKIAGKIMGGSKMSAKEAARKKEKILKNLKLFKDLSLTFGKPVYDAQKLEDGEISLPSDTFSSAFNRASQALTIYDTHTPLITTSDSSLTVEATNFGGIFFSRLENELKDTLTAWDNCGKTVGISHDAPDTLPFGETVITWTVHDGGVYAPGIDETSSIRQIISVVDTQAPILVPPAGFAVESDDAIDLSQDTLFLGVYQVADLADPNPSVSRDAPQIMTPGYRYRIEYSATDNQGNSTTAPEDDPQRYTQIVTIKQPGINMAPTAAATSAETITAEPVAITLEGIDLDELPMADTGEMRTDPLDFAIWDRPAHGEFVAPLYPYFIEDLRAKPTTEETYADWEDVSCPADVTSGSELNAQLGYIDRVYHNEFVEKCYCRATPKADPPRDLIYNPRFMHITDEGVQFVSDSYWYCTNDPSGSTRTRLSKFSADGELLAENTGSNGGGNSGVFQVDADNNLHWTTLVGSGSSRDLFVNSVNSDLVDDDSLLADNAKYNSSVTKDVSPGIYNNNLVNSHIDARAEVIYVTDKSRIYMFDYNDPTSLLGVMKDNEEFVKGCSLDGGSRDGFWMETDADSNLYLVCTDRVHKMGPPQWVDGVKVPGAYIGWLGKCLGNYDDPETNTPYSYCNEDTQTSKGFQCTDETCVRAEDSNDSYGAVYYSYGDGAGQFKGANFIEVGPDNVLYITESTNQRVQRFSPDGVFAGMATSTGDGVAQDGSFVLGNMGSPSHVSVNSSSFHVLERDPASANYFLHIYKTLPFYDVTDSSAKVDYISDYNFQGTDTFSYLVDDGIAKSATATVTVNVARAYRAPENLRAVCYSDEAFTMASNCEINEDTALYIRLMADDPDGFIGFGGLDELTYTITELPLNGELTTLATEVSHIDIQYSPEENYFGSDALTFVVTDGNESADEDASVSINVLPVEDPVEVLFEESYRFGRGFKTHFRVDFEDPDGRSFAQPEANLVGWGDGENAQKASNWEYIGVYDEEGVGVEPQSDTLPGEGFISGAHSYDFALGGIHICFEDGSLGQICRTSIKPEIVEVVSLQAFAAQLEPVEPEQVYAFNPTITNEQPDYWTGLTADAVVVQFSLPTGISAITVDERCTLNSDEYTCELGDIGVADAVELALSVSFDPEIAAEEQYFTIEFYTTTASPTIDPEMISAMVIEVADNDGDGVINYYDAFPDDPNYAYDTDADGMADSWEAQWGLNSEDPSDATADTDGDGATNLSEFISGGSPFLADPVHLGESLSLAESTSGDLYGVTLASGDFNHDGFDDVVVGAPAAGEYGRAFLYPGSADGLSEAIELVPDWASEYVPPGRYGFDIEIGDLNQDGFADIAVASDNIVYIYWGNSDSAVTEQKKIGPPVASSGNMQSVLIGDGDNDGKADLFVGYPDYTGYSAAVMYRASTAYWGSQNGTTPSMTFEVTEQSGFGYTLALADLDANGYVELFMGGGSDNTEIRYVSTDVVDWTANTTDILFGWSFGDINLGTSLAGGVDITGDGFDDLLVGAPDDGGENKVYLWVSGNGVELTQGIEVASSENDDALGHNVALVGVTSFSNAPLIAAGASFFDETDGENAGQLNLYEYGNTDPIMQRSALANQTLGGGEITIGDINGDGNPDIIVGAPALGTPDTNWLEEVAGTQPGLVRIYYGSGALQQADVDDDLISDSLDNCINLANPLQENTDADAFGDACDVDSDNNGLIEISNLTELDAMRNAPDGSALNAITNGCPVSGCNGFELISDLDFDTNGSGEFDAGDRYWYDGSGWQPIEAFSAIFEGNGHRIEHLYVNRDTGSVGLFAALSGATINNISLIASHVSSNTGSAGTLAAILAASLNDTTVTGLVVQGDVYAATNGGGIAAEATNSLITQSVFTGHIQAGQYAGGIVGEANATAISNVWVSGYISGQTAAGIIGQATGDNASSIANSYSLATVDGSAKYGLADGQNTGVTNSYWNTFSSTTSQGAGTGYLYTQLACPTLAQSRPCVPDDLYAAWDTTIWNLGTFNQIPALIINDIDYRDTDNDTLLDFEDEDIDGDGTANEDDQVPYNPNDTVDTDGDGVGDNSDAFPNDPDETDDSDGDGIGDNADSTPFGDTADTDNDGIPDAVEIELGLDINDPDDALGDLDGDGVNNLTEYETGSNPLVDDYPPELTVPTDLTVPATGALTSVDLGIASAVDAKDGAITPEVNDAGPYAPGTHILTWSAADAVGNTSSATQLLNVLPLVSISGTSAVEEGQNAVLTFSLNGSAPDYPVTIVYSLTGTAANDSDIDGASGEVTINNGDVATLSIDTIEDDVIEGDEQFMLNIISAEGAVVGNPSVHTVTISEQNLAPRVTLHIMQAGEQVATAYTINGLIDIEAVIDDPNPGDSHTLDWSASSEALLEYAQPNGTALTVEPDELNGVYELVITVTDDSGAAVTYRQVLRILNDTPVVLGEDDSDGDGLSDIDEGAGDSNGNGIADYLDPYSSVTQLATSSSRGPITVSSGLTLRTGDAAYASGNARGSLSHTQLQALYGDSANDNDYEFVGELFDFVITGVATGGSAQVVLPLSEAIPANAVYRKFNPNTGWFNLVVNSGNAVASAAGTDTTCPAPGSSEYSTGLQQGHYCVQLTLQDGGENDADGLVNGAISDPGGVATQVIPVPTVTASLQASVQSAFTRNSGEQIVMTFTLNSDSSDVLIQSFTLQGAGSMNEAEEVGQVAIYLDANSNGVAQATERRGTGEYNTDNGILTVTLDSPVNLPVGDSRWLVTYEF